MIGPAYFLIKQTFFKHFVAGENIKESLKVVSDLKNQGILSILDYSVEAIQDDVDDVVNTIISTIEVSEKRGFACFKMTALTSTHLLLRMSQLIEHSEANPNFKIPWDFPNHSGSLFSFFVFLIFLIWSFLDSMTQVVDRLISASIESTSDLEPNHLNQDELFELRSLCQRMERIADAAMTQQVSVLVDAEQSYYQTAIHFLVRSLYRKYNRGYHPIIYGTYQLYIKSTLDTLKADIENGRKDGYAVGAKLVRGAYMDSEREHALLMGNSDPINDTIEDTHKCYNDAIKILLDEIYQGNGSSIMIATHNEESILYASQLMEERGLASNHEKVYFAQLHAMCNHITLSLSKHGYNSCKYVPFGPLKSVAPYLIRRMVENKGFIGKSNGERELIKAELSRRFSGEQPQPVVDYK